MERKELLKELEELSKDPKVSKALELKAKLDKIEKAEKEQDNVRIEKLGFTENTTRLLQSKRLTTFGKLKNITVQRMKDYGVEKAAIDEVCKVLKNLGVEIKNSDKPNYKSTEECRDELLARLKLAKAI